MRHNAEMIYKDENALYMYDSDKTVSIHNDKDRGYVDADSAENSLLSSRRRDKSASAQPQCQG